MKTTSLIAAAAFALIAAPALADTSPAERFGALNGNIESSPAAYDMAVEKLSGDDLKDKILRVTNDVPTRNVTLRNQQIAADLGVDAADYTTAELAKMYIGKYD